MRINSVLEDILPECKWVADNYPQVLLGENLWWSWYGNLSEYDILNLRMNRGGIVESRDLIIWELDLGMRIVKSIGILIRLVVD